MTDEERLLDAVSTLLQVFLVSEKAFPPAEGRLAFNPVDFNTIRIVAQGPTRPGAIASQLGISATTMSSVVARLERQDILGKRQDPRDHRARLLELTEQGTEICAAIRRQDLANMRAMLATLSEADRPQFLTLMDRVADGLGRME